MGFNIGINLYCSGIGLMLGWRIVFFVVEQNPIAHDSKRHLFRENTSTDC
jgi:hypothetical protein